MIGTREVRALGVMGKSQRTGRYVWTVDALTTV